VGLRFPASLAVTTSGVLAVNDQTAGFVLLFNATTGAPITIPNSIPATGTSIATYKNQLYTVNNQLTQIYDLQGNLINSFTGLTTSNTFVIAVDQSTGAVYDSDTNGAFIRQAIPITSATVKGDPAFTGLMGQQYQVHGIDGAVYALISSPRMALNGRFTFLPEAGGCPLKADGFTPLTLCWSHPGSYISQLGLQEQGLSIKATLQQLRVDAGPAKQGFSLVRHNGQNVHVGDSFTDLHSAFSFHLLSPHELEVKTEQFVLTLHNSHLFLNLASVQARVPLPQLAISSVHGLLGQTHTTKLYSSTLKVVEGDVDDYVVEGGSLFDTAFLYSTCQLHAPEVISNSK